MKKTPKILQAEMRHVDDLRPNPWNPNVMDEKTMELTKLSIVEEGFSDPIDIDPTGMILDGEHRWLCAKELGIEEIPVFVKDRQGDDAVITTIRKDRTHGEPDLIKLSGIIGTLVDELGTDEVERRLGYDEREQEAMMDVAKWDWDAYDIGDEDAVREERENEGVTWTCGLAPGIAERLDALLDEYDGDLKDQMISLFEDARQKAGMEIEKPVVKEEA